MKMALKKAERISAANGVNLIKVTADLTQDDGTTILFEYTFPDDTLEWRAAEYEIDPTDLDTLLDIVLYEPHLPADDQPELSLHHAPTVKSARDRHLARIEAILGTRPGNRPAGFDPVREEIKRIVPINSHAVQIKAAFVEQSRAAIAREKAARKLMAESPEVAEAMRVQTLRQALEARLPHGSRKAR